ncbi:hypothetical protein [uncultured Tateyamaria sp.]|uniref:hypothetical protein n=1 Tax=Tateyamaria sp. 1078 TaxID=3417464 RepID=UPI0026147112|nr:hypothetical protein [uncultured Tateyamaria sp.]
MPVAIVMSNGSAIPAVLSENTESALLDALRNLSDAPALKTAHEARQWLQSLPAPSGWFGSPTEARAHVQRMHEPVPAPSGDEVRHARESLSMSRADFATALGFGGNTNTRHKLMHDIEVEAVDRKSGRQRVLNAQATMRMRALLSDASIDAVKSHD